MSLTKLLERVEGAEGADREIDKALAVAFGWSCADSGNDWHDEVWTRPDGYSLPIGSLANPPFFTASLDAALGLCEEKFSGGLGWWLEMETAGMGAVLRGAEGEEFRGGGVGKDLCSAVIAAMLQALISQGKDGRSGDGEP